MRVSSYNLQDRYRRRAAERFAGITVVLIILFVSFGLGFWIGKQVNGQTTKYLKSEMKKMSAEREQMQNTLTELRAESQTALARYEQLQETYQEILPEGPMQDLTKLLKQQLDEGRDPERLEFLIRSARPPRGCTEPETKRFVVSNPGYSGTDSTISIADGALIITASGESAKNAEGQPEAWYDPSKQVAFTFTGQGGVEETKAGIMPLNHSIVVGDREYRLAIAEGARSFAKVTYDSCDYP